MNRLFSVCIMACSMLLSRPLCIQRIVVKMNTGRDFSDIEHITQSKRNQIAVSAMAIPISAAMSTNQPNEVIPSNLLPADDAYTALGDIPKISRSVLLKGVNFLNIQSD